MPTGFQGERTNRVSRDEVFKGASGAIVAHPTHRRYLSLMSTFVEVERLALDLAERERATLAASLLDSLPGILSNEDDGIAEALRRDVQIDANRAQAISLAELDSYIQRQRG